MPETERDAEPFAGLLRDIGWAAARSCRSDGKNERLSHVMDDPLEVAAIVARDEGSQESLSRPLTVPAGDLWKVQASGPSRGRSRTYEKLELLSSPSIRPEVFAVRAEDRDHAGQLEDDHSRRAIRPSAAGAIVLLIILVLGVLAHS